MVGKPPAPNAKTEAKLAYLESGALLVGAAILCLILAAIGAVILTRAARKEYSEELAKHLQGLVKGKDE